MTSTEDTIISIWWFDEEYNVLRNKAKDNNVIAILYAISVSLEDKIT